MAGTNNIFTGRLVYKDIEFQFVFDQEELRLIPPKEKSTEIQRKWIMTEIGNGVFTMGDPLLMEEPYLIGKCHEDGKQIIFIVRKGDHIASRNKVLFVKVIAYIKCIGDSNGFDSISIYSPEINRIHPIGSSFIYKYSDEAQKDGECSISTLDFESSRTLSEEFTYKEQPVKVNFGSSRTISMDVNKNPISIDSTMNLNFDKTQDYAFVYELWRIAKQFVQYLCYRRDIYFAKVTLGAMISEETHGTVAEMFVLCDKDAEFKADYESLKKGRIIQQRYIQGHIGSIFQDIANDTIYTRHIPKSYEDGRHITAARFIMITAAFEWEFRKIYPDGVKKKASKIQAEGEVESIIQNLIDENSGEKKSIFKFLKKLVRSDSLSNKVTYVGRDLENIMDVFGKQLYHLNDHELKYSEMGERLATQRNNYAHGNLDKDFIGMALLDVIFMEWILYAMQLKAYGIEDNNIRHVINELFQRNFILPEEN